MFNQLLIEEAFNQPWCIEKSYAQGLAMAALGAFKNQNHDLKAISTIVDPYVVDQGNNEQAGSYEPGSVGVITLDGPVVENSDLRNGIKGTQAICDEFEAMEADPSIIGTVFVCNTGGGAAYAMKPLEDAFSARTKPLGIFAKRILASAGYGLGAHGDFIMMYHPQGIVGSIGTMMSFSNLIPMFEKWGIEFHEIYATLSTLKNKNYNDALKGEYDSLRESIIDPFNNNFIKSVKGLRGNKISPDEKGIFQGETFMAKKAIKLGLIDQLGTLSDAISNVRDLAKTKSALNKAPIKSKQEDTNMKFPLLMSLAGKTDATQEELAAINAELTQAGITSFGVYPESVVTEGATATASLKAATEKVASLEKDLGDVKGELTNANAEIVTLKEKLSKAPAATAPKVEPKEMVTEPTPQEKAQATMNELAHNKAIENNPLFN